MVQEAPPGVVVDPGNKSFRVFYRDYANDVKISSGNPESLAADRLTSLAENLLTSADNFLGILDSNEVILQLYLDRGETVVLELLYPEATGCMQCRLNIAEAMQLLAKLPDQFEENMLPGANYIG